MDNSFKYLIIGGGMTASAAICSLREADKDSAIGLITAESHQPYDRPPLSKGLWKDSTVEEIKRNIDYSNVDIFLNRFAQKIDTNRKVVTDSEGRTYRYEKLLLATGGSPRQLPFGNGHIIYYRTLSDYERLRQLAAKHDKFVVIGGGFIGAEVAAALAINGKRVTMVFPDKGICARLFPAGLSQYITDTYREKGVEVLTDEEVIRLSGNDTDLKVVTMSGREIRANGVVAGIGIEVNTELAESAGLSVDNGIVVDKNLRTSNKDIYAAGDVAVFYDPFLEKYRRVEHEDNALTMGGVAGTAMAGDEETEYNHSPMFYSDMFDMGYEAVGELNSDLEMVENWQEKYKKGIVYYLKEGKVRGVLLWNVWDQVSNARNLIAENATFTPQMLKDQIPFD
ncbi:MAG: FAD-dependent oxidoreductase [Anaerolineae bacterium]|nr:FAD-dependent oxidoreductase [Anaerolineae bacterium]